MRQLFCCLTLVSMLLLSLAARAADDRSGAEVFDDNCAGCHTGGFAGFFGGAPDVEDADDWEALLPKGLDALTASTLAGVGSMAARGGCDICTDGEIRAAVAHMLEVVAAQ